jgi:hypothetical protein
MHVHFAPLFLETLKRKFLKILVMCCLSNGHHRTGIKNWAQSMSDPPMGNSVGLLDYYIADGFSTLHVFYGDFLGKPLYPSVL